MGKIITLDDFRGVAVRWSLRWSPGEKTSAGAPALAIDDLLSGSSDDLAIEVDPSGNLVLVEGCDFE